MKNKGKSLAKGSIIRMAEFFTVAVVTLMMTPFIIRSLGESMYGLWIFIGSFIGYYGLMDLGLNSAVQRFLSRAIGSNDKKEFNKIINTALIVYSVLGALVFILAVVIAAVLPELIKNITEVVVFRKAVVILGLSLALGFPLRVFSGILNANLRYDINAIVEIVKLFVRTFLIIVLLKSGFGIISLALITLLTNIGGYIANYSMVKHIYHNEIQLSCKFFEITRVKSLFGYSVYTFIAQIADQLRFNIDNLVITIFIGLSSVTIYSIAFRLVKYFGQFIAASMGMFLPVFSQYEAKGDYNSIREKFIFATKISGYLSIMIGGILIIFGKAFIQRWVGSKFLDAYPLMIVLVISSVFALMQTTSVQLLYGLSKNKFYAISNSIEGAANLILSIILVRKYGLLGVALGTAIPMLFIKLFVQPVYVCRAINLNVRVYYFKILFPILLKASVALSCFWWLIKNLIAPNYLNILFLAICGCAIFLAFVFFICFRSEERNYFKKIIIK